MTGCAKYIGDERHRCKGEQHENCQKKFKGSTLRLTPTTRSKCDTRESSLNARATRKQNNIAFYRDSVHIYTHRIKEEEKEEKSNRQKRYQFGKTERFK